MGGELPIRRSPPISVSAAFGLAFLPLSDSRLAGAGSGPAESVTACPVPDVGTADRRSPGRSPSRAALEAAKAVPVDEPIGLRDHPAQLFQIHRLRHEVERPALHRLYRRLMLPWAVMTAIGRSGRVS